MIRVAGQYNRDEASIESGLVCGESMTHQEFKEECDINTLCRRFGLGYQMPQGVRIPTYGDFSHISDYHQALNAIAMARESFDTLPAHVRERFVNDPGRFVDFCSDSRNRPEMEAMGLLQSAPARSASVQATTPPTKPSEAPAAAPAAA